MPRSSLLCAFPAKTVLFVCLLLVLTFGLATPVSGNLGFNVIIRDTQVEAISGQLTHEVEAYVSVLDNEGAPIKNLQNNNFTVLENSQPVEFSITEGANTALNLVLAMDTSYGMAGSGLASAQKASTRFISRMSKNDNIAILSFNTKVAAMVDFTNDQSAVTNYINKLAAAPGTGTCLYDGIYKAIQMVSAQPEGQHAVLVMTDGRDEMPNSDKPCSAVTIDDVIHLATTGKNIPIYAIGVGNQIDEKSLDRLALLTGGSLLLSKDFTVLDSGFDKIFSQMKDQYELSYISKAPSGEHSLTVRVNIGGEKDEDRRGFLVTEAMPIVAITTPSDGQILKEKTTIAISITGQKDLVKQVEFQVEDKVVSNDSSSPYEFTLDPADFKPGPIEITASAIDATGKVLGKTSVRVTIPGPAPTPTPVTPPTAAPTITPVPTATPQPAVPTSTTTPAEGSNGNSVLLWIIGGGAGLVIALVVLGIVIVKPFGKNKSSNFYQPAPPQPPTPTPSPAVMSEATFDNVAFGALAELTVLFSDDPSRAGERIAITQMVTSIGRGSTNDISFPNDHPVSRKHILLEQRGGTFWVSEVLSESDSGPKPPTFGTFVNDQKVAGSPVALKTGDEIRLGSRLKVKFQSFMNLPGRQADSEATVDVVDDSTID